MRLKQKRIKTIRTMPQGVYQSRICQNDIYARRLQVQERLTTQIANTLMDELDAYGVAVSITAEHFCVKTRGIQDMNSVTTTSKLLGLFKDDARARAEFLTLIKE